MKVISRKKGYTLIEIVVYLSLSLLITTLVFEIFIGVNNIFLKCLNRSNNLNIVENTFISIYDIARDPRVVKMEKENESLKIYYSTEINNTYEVKHIKKNNKDLVVEYYQNKDGIDIILGRVSEKLMLNINDFKVYEKENVIYIKVIKDSDEYIKSI